MGLLPAGTPGQDLAVLMSSDLNLLFSEGSFSLPFRGASQEHHFPNCKMRGLPTSPLLSGVLSHLSWEHPPLSGSPEFLA